ncbi:MULTISPECIES: hypothetical protein [unclassified Aminobacter]|uniref:hypothetical protein n=1 Tax=unclassified Aminobacter TaxID=2644704 RepID=UPI0004B0A69B|nr:MULTISPECIES: hypothetical protein [unclassified Aminobacter]
MKAERVESSLHPRSWSFNRQPDSSGRQFLLLTDGSAEAETEGSRFTITAPACLWLGTLASGRLRVDAGATGYRCWTSEPLVIAAIGDQAESVGLHQLADRNFALSLTGQAEHAPRWSAAATASCASCASRLKARTCCCRRCSGSCWW